MYVRTGLPRFVLDVLDATQLVRTGVKLSPKRKQQLLFPPPTKTNLLFVLLANIVLFFANFARNVMGKGVGGFIVVNDAFISPLDDSTNGIRVDYETKMLPPVRLFSNRDESNHRLIWIHHEKPKLALPLIFVGTSWFGPGHQAQAVEHC